MKNNLFKSIWSVLAGFIFVVITSGLTDFALISLGAMKQPFDLNSTAFILLVVLYRSAYGVGGSYITARLAPQNPMKHSMIGGGIGLALTIVGAAVMWHLPPHWYPISLMITTLPCAWLGARLFLGGK